MGSSAISLQTNVSALVAEQNLNVNNAFQSKTIEQLTSGYRINSSADDPAGLAVANMYREQEAELTQGVQNANDGISTLQIADSGMNNISQMLDSLDTLATQSASSTFAGDRATLNNEFQTLLGEIDQEAQSIGLNTGGEFAKSLSIYVGGGRNDTGGLDTSNGTVSMNLSNSAVDTQALGLSGMQAVAGTADLSSTSATSVANILADTSNQAALSANPGYTTFDFTGPGFSDNNQIAVSVNLSGVTDTQSLANAINAGIQSAAAGDTAAATAFKNAGIVASVNTDSNGGQELAFTSSTSAFQVQAGDQMSNALMGNFSADATGASMSTQVIGAAHAATSTAMANDVYVKISGAGMATPTTLTLTGGGDATVGSMISQLQGDLSDSTDYPSLAASGISLSDVNGQYTFTNSKNQSFSVEVTGDTADALGFGAYQASSTASADYTSITAGSAYSDANTTNGAATNLEFSVGGGPAIAIGSISLAGGNATAANLTSTAIGNPVGITTGVNDQLTFSVGTNDVNVTLAAAGSAGSATATSHEFKSGDADVVVASPNNTMWVSLNGGTAQQVTLAAGTYKAADDGLGGVNDIVAAVNTGLTAAFGAGAATASVNASGDLVISSNTLSAASSVVVTDDPTKPGLLGQLFGAGGATSASGTDGATAATIAGEIQTQATAQLAGTGAGVTVTSNGGVIEIANNALGAASDNVISAMSGNATTAGQWADGLFTANVGANRTGDNLVGAINNELQANSTLAAAGLTASWNSNTNEISFSGTQAFRMNAGAAPAQGTVVGTTDLTDGANFSASPMTLQISTDGGSAVTVNLNQNYSSAGAIAADIQSQLAAAGSNAVATTTSINGKTYLELQAGTTGTAGSVQVLSGGTANTALGLTDNTVHANSAQVSIGFGVSGSTNTGAQGLSNANSSLSVVDASGTSQTGAIAFQALTDAGAKTQSLTISANNSSGNLQSMTVTLAATGAGTAALANDGSGDSIDDAIQYINSQLQQSNNPTLQQIVAVKQVVGGNEEINFVSALPGFEVGVGSANNKEGLNAGVAKAAMGVETGTASTVSIATLSDAVAAVTAVANAVTTLGNAQGAVGASENQLNYAIDLAQSQVTNFASAESQIRDADVAAEAANLSKAQVLQQASIAAMAQANSAPQAVLALLRT